MREENKYTVYIDTFSDPNQNPSKFKVKLNNWFLRNNIKNSDNSKKDWYVSVKSLAMLNSFSNITRDINDSVIIYTLNAQSFSSFVPQYLSSIVSNTDYTKNDIRLDEGNPNVTLLQQQINTKLIALGLGDIKFTYSSYDSKFKISINANSIKLCYIHFPNSHDLFGFQKEQLYYLRSNIYVNNTIIGYKNVNLHSDRLIRFEIAGNSDFRLKNMNYSNVLYGSFQDCNIFHLQPVNVLPYDLIYYTRNTDELIPIELHKNSITDFQINVANQDGDNIEGLADWIMVLEFTQVKTWNYDVKIYNVLKELYLWIAMFFRNKI